MKITDKELLYLASIGASHESISARNMNDPKTEAHFSRMLDTVTQAQTVNEVLEGKTNITKTIIERYIEVKNALIENTEKHGEDAPITIQLRGAYNVLHTLIKDLGIEWSAEEN